MIRSGFSSFRRWFACCAAAAALFSAPASHAAYVLTEISRPGAETTGLFDINNAGTMVGYSSRGSGLATESRAFITTDGLSFTELSGPSGAVASFALGISDSGTVVGNYHTSLTVDGDGNAVFDDSRGFIYSSGSYTELSIAGATGTFLRGVSADGRYVTGHYSTAAQAGVGFVFDTTTSTLQVITTPDSLFTIMQGINASGVVVGSDIQTGGDRPGLLYDLGTGTLTEASIGGAQRTALRSIEDDGTLAGWFRDAGGDVHGFVGSLSSYEEIDFAGADATFVEGSNRAGVLVGTASIGDRFVAYIARPGSAVPEPAGLPLLALAALAAAAASRRQRGRA